MWRATWIGGLISMALLAGCSEDKNSDEPPPLQPLIYTEDPDLTPEGAAVREQRLQRQLVEGVTEGPWGRLQPRDVEDLPTLDDPQVLGESIVEALTTRNEVLWEHVFVDADEYVDLVHVDRDSAREFVDNQMGKSLKLWELFAAVDSSEMPEGGLNQRIRFRDVTLGDKHTIDGAATSTPDDTAQYWNNHLVVEDVDTEVEFQIEIPRILVVEDGERRRLKVGSAVDTDPRFEVFLDAGLHLKPELLRAREYPFPLGVGTFWRYRRHDADDEVDDARDPLEQQLDERPEGVAAEEVIVEIRDVARYEPVRLVELLRSYDDRRRTRSREFWVLTPNRIYACDQACRDHIEDVEWLLAYFQRRVPLMVFPVHAGSGWKEGGVETSSQAVFSVDDQWHDHETPAGTFTGTYRIEGTADVGRWDRYLRRADVVRYFAPERGVVRRVLRNSGEEDEGVDVVEELVEYRIMH